jgi:glucokinase
MKDQTVIGIDLGGTNIRAGLVKDGHTHKLVSTLVPTEGQVQDVLNELFFLTDKLVNEEVSGIGIGVPGLVDPASGVVFDVINISSWEEVPLQQLMEKRYHLPVAINNDANCFALGEYFFGKGMGHKNMVGLTIGTGLGAGIILNGELYSGGNGAAGEFGMVPYLDKYLEYYASGQFFQNCYGMDGGVVYQQALRGEEKAIRMYQEFGHHLGNAIKTILYALDMEYIILGGSVRHAYPYYSNAMWEQIKTLAFVRSVKQLKIERSELENGAILGAAGLVLSR